MIYNSERNGKGMKIGKENGFTGVDIAISVVVLFIFVSLISFLIYNFNSSSKQLELKSEAIEIAVDKIEQLKNTLDFSDIMTKGTTEGDTEYEGITEVNNHPGFFSKVLMEDYHLINPEKQPGVVKKITVEIQYQFKGKTETVSLSTIITRNN